MTPVSYPNPRVCGLFFPGQLSLKQLAMLGWLIGTAGSVHHKITHWTEHAQLPSLYTVGPSLFKAISLSICSLTHARIEQDKAVRKSGKGVTSYLSVQGSLPKCLRRGYSYMVWFHYCPKINYFSMCMQWQMLKCFNTCRCGYCEWEIIISNQIFSWWQNTNFPSYV